MIFLIAFSGNIGSEMQEVHTQLLVGKLTTQFYTKLNALMNK